MQRLRASIATNPSISSRMSGIRTRDTAPELVVRRLVSSTGRRFRIENRDLIGSPDLANRARRWVIFVHGCFWHRHPGCPRAELPRTNRDFWKTKLLHNTVRDRRVARALRSMGYAVILVWACATRDEVHLRRRLDREVPT